MSNQEWTLDPELELEYLTKFYLKEGDTPDRRELEEFIAKLVAAPAGRGAEDEHGTLSAHVGRTGIVVVRLLDWEKRTIVLAAVDRE